MSGSHFLESIFRVNDFSPEEIQLIISKFQPLSFARNEYFLKEGKTENYYWFIENGFARSYVMDVSGNDTSTNFYGPGEIVIDWTSFFLRHPTRENIQALTDCDCWQLDFETFQQLFHNIKSFREQGRTTLVGSYFSLKKHSVSMIADQARERYLQLQIDRPLVVQNVSLKHLATYLGITDTSLSRIRKEIAGG